MKNKKLQSLQIILSQMQKRSVAPTKERSTTIDLGGGGIDDISGGRNMSEKESVPILCLSISDVSGTDESVEQHEPERYLATSPVIVVPVEPLHAPRTNVSISSCAEMIDDYYEDEDFEKIEIEEPEEEDDSSEQVSVLYKDEDAALILQNNKSFAPSIIHCPTFVPPTQESILTDGHNEFIHDVVVEEFKLPKQQYKKITKKPQSLQQRVFRGIHVSGSEIADDDSEVNNCIGINKAESTIEEVSNLEALDEQSLTIERSTINASIQQTQENQDDYCPSQAMGKKVLTSFQSRNYRESTSTHGIGKSIEHNNLHQTTSKDSLPRASSSFQNQERTSITNKSRPHNLKTSSFKSVKCASGVGVSDQRYDASDSKQDSEVSPQQEQYSSHKVLISGRHIAIGMDSSNFKEQPHINITHTVDDQKNAGTSQNASGRRAALSKQRKLKGLAKAVHNQKGGTGTSNNRDSSEYTAQLHIYSSTSKNASGPNGVTSSLQQLFSGGPNAGQNKRGQSSNNNNSQMPLSQKQSKSKARMIRNILHTSNLNTAEKKVARASKATTIQTSDLGESKVPINNMTTPHVRYEPLMCVAKLGPTERSMQTIDEAFADLFAGMLEDFGAEVPATVNCSPTKHLTEIRANNMRAELDLNKAQVRQRYGTLRQNLRDIHSKFENQKRNEIERIEGRLSSLNLTLKVLLKRAQIEIEHVRSREHTRIWRNCNKLSANWISSLLVEAEKSRLFALMKTKRSFSSIIFTTQEFPLPHSVGSKSQRGSTDSQTPQSQQITRDMFSEFQTQEVFKFFSKLSSPLQFLMDLRAKPFQVLKGQVASTEAITAEILATQKRQSFPQAVLDFARHNVDSAESKWEAYPVCVMSPTSTYKAVKKHVIGTQLKLMTQSQHLPTPFLALQGTHDLLRGQDGYRQAKITNCPQRRPDSLVSNAVLDVLHAGCKRLSENRYVYVCLKEAQAMDVELPRHSQMLSRISNNKAISRLYEGATPITQCLRKATAIDSGVARTQKIKAIKGLRQVKVEFVHSHNPAGKLFGVLAEIDLSILKQTKEFVQFFLPAQSHALIHEKQGDNNDGVSLYVLEQAQHIRQLEPFEVLFLLQSHMRFTKPVKLLDFVLNVNEMTYWKASNNKTEHRASFKSSAKPNRFAEGRNSVTAGSIHYDNEAEEQKDHHFTQASTSAVAGGSDASSRYRTNYGDEPIITPHESRYLTIDERGLDGTLVKRFIVRVVCSDRDSEFEQPLLLAKKQAGSLCVWPNCLKMTDESQTVATVQAIMLQLTAYQQQQLMSSTSTTQTQGQQSQFQHQAAPQSQQTNVTSRKNRPESAYRQKQNTSNANNQVSAGSNQQSGSTAAGLASNDKVQVKRIHKLRMALELDMTENIYWRFIKKGKALKEKNQNAAIGSGVQSKVRANWISPTMTLATASQARTIADAINLAPILTTITQGGGALNGGLNIGPLFEKMCPFHQGVERHLVQRFNVQFQVAGPLNPNAFLKGLRVFDSWRSEAKSSLINDLFVMKSVPQHSGMTAQTTVFSDTLHRIFNFACSQVSSFSGPDIVNLIQILQQLPRSINYPDKFFAWIERFARQMSPFMVKNAQFNDAVAHFQFQLAPLCSNLKQVKLNEDFISIELKKWMNNTTGLQQIMTPQQRAYLRNNFAQLMKILTVTDVIHRFTFFQQFINKMTTQAGDRSQHDHHNATPLSKSGNQSNNINASNSKQSNAAATKGILTQKANLMPYATAGGVGKPIRVIPPEGILFQSSAHQHQVAGSFQPQVVVPLSVLGGNDQSPGGVQLSHPLSHQSIGGVKKLPSAQQQQQQLQNSMVAFNYNIGSGPIKNFENASTSVIQTKGKLNSSSIVDQRGSFTVMNSQPTSFQQQPQQMINQTKGQSTASLQATLLPNAGQANNALQAAPANSLDKITAIYGGYYRKSTKDQQPYQTAQVPTPMSQTFMMASDGFLSHKKTSLNPMTGNNFDQLSQPRPSGQGEGSIMAQDYFETAASQHQRDLFSLDLKESSRALPAQYQQQQQQQQQQQAGIMAAKTQNLFTESNARQRQQQQQLQQSTEMFKTYNTACNQPQQLQMYANATQSHGFTAHKNHVIAKVQDINALDQPGPTNMRPNTCHNVQSSGLNEQHRQMQQAINGNSNSRGKQRSMRTQQNGQTSLLQQKTMANHASAEQVTILAKSPKKRILTKNGAVSQAIACSYSTQEGVVDNQGLVSNQVYTNFLPSQQAYAQQRSRENQGCLDKPSYQSAGHNRVHNVGVSAELANFSSAVVSGGDECTGGLLMQQHSFARRQGSQSKKKSFGGKQQNNSQMHQQHNHTTGANPGGHSTTKLGAGKPQRRQRATSAKKEIIATYSKGAPGPGSQKPGQASMPLSSKQNWSMQPSSFGQALAQEQNHLMSNNFVKEPGQAGRLSLIAGPGQQPIGVNQSMEPLVPQRYSSNQAARSQMDWFLKKNKGAQQNPSALNVLIAPTQDNSKTIPDSMKKPTQDHQNVDASKYATETQYQIAPRYESSVGFNQANFVTKGGHKSTTISNRDTSLTMTRTNTANPIHGGNRKKKSNQQQPMLRVPPQMADRRINYSSGIRIINSVLTPSNAPRSAVNAKAQQADEDQNYQQPVVRNITSAGYPHSAKQSQNMIEVQRTTMIFNNSSSVHQTADTLIQNQGSKGVTQQLMNLQMQRPTPADKQQHLQVTYANAMPRLASANAYLTKQSRKLRPANRANNKGLTSQNLHADHRNNNALNLPSKEQQLSAGTRDAPLSQPSLVGLGQLDRSKSKLLNNI